MRRALTLPAILLLSARVFGAELNLDVLSAQKTLCLHERTANAMKQGPDACNRLTRAQEPVIAGLARQFCREPVAFCTSARRMFKQGPAKGFRQFVGPRCESPTIMQLADQLDFAGFGSQARKLMLKAWDCRLTPRRMSCDAAKLGFDCRTGTLRPGGPKSPDGPEAQANETNLKALVREMKPRLEGGRCVLVLPEGSARDGRLNELASRVYGSQGRYAEATRSLLAAEHAPGVSVAKMVRAKFTAAKTAIVEYLRDGLHAPGVIIDAVRNTELAGVEAFLAPNPTPEQKKEMDDSEKSCASSGEHAFGIPNSMNGCTCVARTGSENGSTYRTSHQVWACPAIVLSALYGNPKSLLAVFAHELGHSIDPCALAQMKSAATLDMDDVKPAPSDPCSLKPDLSGDELSGVTAFQSAANAFTDCLYDHSELGRMPGGGKPQPEVRRGGMTALWKRLLDVDKAAGPTGALSASERCVARDASDPNGGGKCASVQFFTGGTLYNLSQPLKEKDPKLLDELDREFETRQLIQADQGGEAFADNIAAATLARASALDDPDSAAFRPEEREADVLTSLTAFCGSSEPTDPREGRVCANPYFICEEGTKTIPSPDEHPMDFYRVSLFSSNPELRARVCPPSDDGVVSGNGTQLPSLGCRLEPLPKASKE